MTSARGGAPNNMNQVNSQTIATENMGFLNELPIDTPQTIDPNSNTVFYRNDDPNMKI